MFADGRTPGKEPVLARKFEQYPQNELILYCNSTNNLANLTHIVGAADTAGLEHSKQLEISTRHDVETSQ